jgi:N-acetylneuraminic acid mutarotase
MTQFLMSGGSIDKSASRCFRKDRLTNCLDDVYEYNPATESGREMTPIPTKKSNFGSFAVGGKIYVIGGTYRRFALLLQTVEEFEVAANRWRP